MAKLFKVKSVKKPKRCKGCNKWIETGSSCVYQLLSWKGLPYKAYYHDKRCVKDG